jgi:hypothetical protein
MSDLTETAKERAQRERAEKKYAEEQKVVSEQAERDRRAYLKRTGRTEMKP